LVIPDEAKDLIRFLAYAWSGADSFVWENATAIAAISEYPMVQGTPNQLRLKKIGEQKINYDNVAIAVEAMLTDI
ncbi:MAG: hypothetical protein V3R32_01075, partial [Nitrosomonadaceae bacterium]